MFLSGRFGGCGEPGCDPEGYVSNFQIPSLWPNEAGPSRQRIPSGRYRLFLVADGAPVRIELRLYGLKGTTLLRPTEPAPVELKTPTTYVSILSGPSYFSAGDEFEGGNLAYSVTFMSAVGPEDWTPSGWGACNYWGNALPGPAGFSPACPPTSGFAFGGWQDSSRFDLVFINGYQRYSLAPGDGTRAQGVWLWSRNPLERVVSHIFNVRLEEST